MPSNQYDESGNPIENGNVQDGITTSTAPTNAPSFGGGVQTQGSNPAAGPQKKGSGRFANLQAYVKANEGAGQQLGSRIEKQAANQVNSFNNQINPLSQQITGDVATGSGKLNKAETLGNNISGLTTKFATGTDNAYKTQAARAGTEFGNAVSGLTSALSGDDGNNLNTVVSGKAFDRDGLKNNQQTLGKAQNDYSGFANDFASQSGTEQGRMNLLSSAITRNKAVAPKYSSGLAGLDQLFMQADPNALRKIEGYGKNVAAQAQTSDQGVRSVADQLNAALSRDTSLQSSLLGVGQSAQEKLLAALNNPDLISSINTDRDQSRNAYRALADKIVNPEIDTQQDYQGVNLKDIKDAQGNVLLDRTGLKVDQTLFNAFDGKNAQEYLELNNKNASSAADIASQSEVDAYQALANKFGLTGNALQQAGDVDNANVGGFAQDNGRSRLETDVGLSKEAFNSALNQGVVREHAGITTGGQRLGNETTLNDYINSGGNVEALANSKGIGGGFDWNPTRSSYGGGFKDLDLARHGDDALTQLENLGAFATLGDKRAGETKGWDTGAMSRMNSEFIPYQQRRFAELMKYLGNPVNSDQPVDNTFKVI